MITPFSIAAGATTLVSDSPGQHWVAVSNHATATTVYCAFDGTATVSGPSGAAPGIPLLPSGTVIHDNDSRISRPKTRGIYVHNPSSTTAVVVTVQEK